MSEIEALLSRLAESDPEDLIVLWERVNDPISNEIWERGEVAVMAEPQWRVEAAWRDLIGAEVRRRTGAVKPLVPVAI